jgi:hypothetical protein
MCRPEYVHCVGFGNAVRTDGKSTWCGNTHELKPFFQDVTHAALNGEQEGRLIVCPECLKAITDALNNGYT